MNFCNKAIGPQKTGQIMTFPKGSALYDRYHNSINKTLSEDVSIDLTDWDIKNGYAWYDTDEIGESMYLKIENNSIKDTKSPITESAKNSFQNVKDWFYKTITCDTTHEETDEDGNIIEVPDTTTEPDWVKVGICSGGVCAMITAIVWLCKKK